MNTHDIVRAGAPELGFGRWYRIIDQPYGFFTIEVRELGEFFGSRRIAKAQSYPHETTADVAAVAQRATERI